MPHDEFSLIRFLTEQQTDGAAAADVEVGIGDDAAVMRWGGGRLVMTCDTMVEHVHFNARTMPMAAVGWKALASTISDLAAMGAEAKFVTVALIVPPSFDPQALRSLYEGLYACAQQYGVAVVGGDTVSTRSDLAVSVTAVGCLPPDESPLLRAQAQAGDIVFVSGYPGCSGAGLHLLLTDPDRQTDFPALCAAHQRPQPQLTLGRMFAQGGLVHSLNDISDGLASEAWELAEASNIGITLVSSKLPIHPELRTYCERSGLEAAEFVLSGGEDYELVGTCAQADWPALQAQAAAAGLLLTAVGTASDSFAGVQWQEKPDGVAKRLAKKGYNHFGNGSTV
jgi:thiamine-monophosphate kinase